MATRSHPPGVRIVWIPFGIAAVLPAIFVPSANPAAAEVYQQLPTSLEPASTSSERAFPDAGDRREISGQYPLRARPQPIGARW